jgi:hypothetical protein
MKMRARFFSLLSAPQFLSSYVRIAACLGLGSLLALSGCSAIEVKLGWRVSLAKIPVAAIEPSLPKDPGIAPGEKNHLVVTVTDTAGKVYVTTGKGKGKVQWKDLAVTPSVVAYNKKGTLSLAADPRVSDGKTGHIDITVPSHPGIQAALDIPLRYNYPFVAKYAGAGGASGTPGTDGTAGMNGSDGSTDPDNPSAGGDGSAGSNGSDGGDGGNGDNGPSVQVFVTLRAGTHPLLQAGALAKGSKKERFYLIDPNGGSLTVSDVGGSGGPGGRGGHGGSGGSGGNGIPPGFSGSSGLDGQDGSSGSDGGGGLIAVTYDPSVAPYLSALILSSPGGPGPVLNEASVAPLW